VESLLRLVGLGWRFGRSRSPPAMWAIRLCCPSCLQKPHSIRTSDQSVPEKGKCAHMRICATEPTLSTDQ